MFELPSETSFRELLPFAILILFGLTLLIQLLYYWLLYRRLAFFRDKNKANEEHPVSVVICARNEYHNLMNNLPLILEQEYPKFEVVVVNDSSDDGTLELLASLEKKYPRLRVFNLEQNLNFFTGKKFPLSLGIKSAKHECILLTDADCRPAGPGWIKSMQTRFKGEQEIVIGYGPYIRRPGLLNAMIRYDTFVSAIQYFSYALAGMPYMGVGRNLMYSRELFYKAKGFISHYKLSSGDDDLFINAMANSRNTAVNVDHESHTFSAAKSTFGQWLYQKKRHYSTAKYYRPRFKSLLIIAFLSKLITYALLPVLIIWNYNLYWILGAFVFFILNHMIILQLCANKLNEKDLVWLSPLLEVILLIMSPLIYITNMLLKQDRWK
jgi:glycosyltransferase involved in cell wall biosynthesis